MPAITLETDVWDLIREQNATTAVTEDTAESDAESGTEAAVTGDEDAALYSKGSTPEEGTSAVSEPAESDAALPVVTELPPPQEEEEQTYVIVLN